MNLKAYDKSTNALKIADLLRQGNVLTGETKNVPLVGVLDCVNGTDLTPSLVAGIRAAGALPLVFTCENLNYEKRLMPATMKYAANYRDMVAKTTAALIRTNLLDGMVAIVDNQVTALGVLTGSTQSKCPVLLLPTGINPHYDETAAQTAGNLATRALKATDLEDHWQTLTASAGIAPSDTLTTALFAFLEELGFMLPGASTVRFQSGQALTLAHETGLAAFTRADDITWTKQLITKKTLATALENYQAKALPVTGILPLRQLCEMVEVKLPVDGFLTLKGLGNTAYVVSAPNAPLTMSGRAWVYGSLTEAMSALTSNAIDDNAVIVVQNCTDCDVSILAKTILTMNKADSMAILTDGYCASTPVLTIANVTPDAFANEEFANIQNGDAIEIDVTKARLTLNVSSKDMKLRTKRNIAKKHEIYF